MISTLLLRVQCLPCNIVRKRFSWNRYRRLDVSRAYLKRFSVCYNSPSLLQALRSSCAGMDALLLSKAWVCWKFHRKVVHSILHGCVAFFSIVAEEGFCS